MMKKMLFVLMALVVAAPAMAITLTGAQNGTTLTANIGYTGNGADAATRARAFALIISVDNGAKITSCVATANHQNGNGYGIFPSTIDADATPIAYGTPVENDNINGIGLPSALQTSQVIVAMGSLYAAGQPAPIAADSLVTITVDKACKVTVKPEVAVRGGVIAEDATTSLLDTNYQIQFDIVPPVTECLKNTDPGYAAWLDFGSPNCWCFQRQCRGDIDGVKAGFWVNVTDLNLFKQAFNKTDAQMKAISTFNALCADLDHTKAGFRVAVGDLNILKTYFNKIDAQVPVCPMTHINQYKN